MSNTARMSLIVGAIVLLTATSAEARRIRIPIFIPGSAIASTSQDGSEPNGGSLVWMLLGAILLGGGVIWKVARGAASGAAEMSSKRAEAQEFQSDQADPAWSRMDKLIEQAASGNRSHTQPLAREPEQRPQRAPRVASHPSTRVFGRQGRQGFGMRG